MNKKSHHLNWKYNIVASKGKLTPYNLEVVKVYKLHISSTKCQKKPFKMESA